MVDKTIDEIRDMVGAVPKTDMYSNPNIKLVKKVEKKKYIFNDEYKDLTKSKVPENIKVLHEGKSKLIELTTPDIDKLETFLNDEFKDKKYKTATERKQEIRKAMYVYIFGPHAIASDSDYIKKIIDRLYEIKIKSVFTKGKKRLRNLAIKEIVTADPIFFDNKRITRREHVIYIHPLETLGKEANIYDEIRETMNGINKENYDKDFLDEAKKIREFYEKQIKKPDYNNFDNRKEMHSHMPETLKEEINQAIEEVKKWEQKKIPDIMKAKKKNLELLEELKFDIEKIKRTYVPSKSFKVTSNETSGKKDLKIDSKDKILKILNIGRVWDGERDSIVILHPNIFKYKQYSASSGYNNERAKVVKKIAKLEIHYNLYFENRWKRSVVLYLFINKKENENNKIYEIWLADGIWGAMPEEDFEQMRPYFDENIKLIKEI
jgi:hypothetical protein